MLSPSEYCLLNGQDFDALPAALVKARRNSDARRLANADWLVRDKQQGQFLATVRNGLVQALRTLPRAFNLNAIWLNLSNPQRISSDEQDTSALVHFWQILGLNPDSYAESSGLSLIEEPALLDHAGKDRYGRPLWLEFRTRSAWLAMQRQAQHEGLGLHAISGFRSHAYQMGIFQRKLQKGQLLNEILCVNAAPGFSEHHTGRALDLGCHGEPPAETSFEDTVAFAWLVKNAASFGFRMSYPRNNTHGISYEPWHWYWQGTD